MAQNITLEMVDWFAYQRSVEESIANETIWAIGGSEFAEDNIADLENELELIIEGEYQSVLDKYDDDVWENYLK